MTRGNSWKPSTAPPLIVAQWINMEHYFSTVDNEVYGSGSKGLSNIVGRVGVMSGASSDLRLGLPVRLCWTGRVPSRTGMAPRGDRGSKGAGGSGDRHHPSLERLFHNEWVSLVVCEPNEATFIIMTSCRAGNRWR